MENEIIYKLITKDEAQILKEFGDFESTCKPVVPSGNKNLKGSYMIPAGYHGVKRNSGNNYTKVPAADAVIMADINGGILADFEGFVYIPEENEKPLGGYEIVFVDKPNRSEKDYWAKKPNDIIKYITEQCFMKKEDLTEKVYAIYVNKDKQILGHTLICAGEEEEMPATVNNRTIVKGALDTNADSVIICHNSIIGTVEPRQKDIFMAGSVKNALGAFSVHLADYLIIGEGVYYSFSEEKSFENINLL